MQANSEAHKDVFTTSRLINTFSDVFFSDESYLFSTMSL